MNNNLKFLFGLPYHRGKINPLLYDKQKLLEDFEVNYKIVTKLNPWLKGNRLTITNKYYTILLPSKNENLKPHHKYS